MNQLSNLEDLLELKLRILYDVETQLKTLLPKVARKIQDKKLKKAVEEHALEIPEEIKKLQDVFTELEAPLKKMKGAGIRGIIEDINWLLQMEAPAVRDAALIGALQYIEHYEIAAYGTARAWAKELGYDDIAKKLGKTAQEEGKTDKELTRIAKSVVNPKAM